MNKELIANYLALYDRAREDEYYLSLQQELAAVNPRLLTALEEMAPEHRDSVLDYLGIVFAVNARLLELSLSSQGKS